MSTDARKCVLCSKDCKLSDSKPHPNSKSKDRIHNRCQIKKALIDKQKRFNVVEKPSSGLTIESSSKDSSPATESNTQVSSMIESLIEANNKIKTDATRTKINKLISDREEQSSKDNNSGSFFFDIKSGIAKPHEKKRYLHHRKITEIVPRYNEDCYQEEAIGRSYDHSGKDLNSLGNDSDDDDSELKYSSQSIGRKRKHSSDLDGHQRYPIKRSHAINIDDENPCWFCLSSPNVEEDLVIAIGDHCYLCLAKGGLVEEHLLIVPIEHQQSVRVSTRSTHLMCELEKFKDSLVRYFRAKSMGVIFFERNFRSVHWQVQAVPLMFEESENLASKIKSISKAHFTKSDYVDIPEGQSISDVVAQEAPYLYWQIEPSGRKFISQIDVKNSFFPIQLPRMVLADEQIMNCEDRIDWKSCTKDKNDYIELVQRIKKEFERFNFTCDFLE